MPSCGREDCGLPACCHSLSHGMAGGTRNRGVGLQDVLLTFVYYTFVAGSKNIFIVRTGVVGYSVDHRPIIIAMNTPSQRRDMLNIYATHQELRLYAPEGGSYR